MSNNSPSKAIRLTHENGGSTLTKTGKVVNQNHGYIVGGFSESILPEHCTVNDFANAWNSKRDECNDSECVGTWTHEGKIYFDVVRIYDDKETAIKIARANKEIAIFDLSSKKSINV